MRWLSSACLHTSQSTLIAIPSFNFKSSLQDSRSLSQRTEAMHKDTLCSSSERAEREDAGQRRGIRVQRRRHSPTGVDSGEEA